MSINTNSRRQITLTFLVVGEFYRAGHPPISSARDRESTGRRTRAVHGETMLASRSATLVQRLETKKEYELGKLHTLMPSSRHLTLVRRACFTRDLFAAACDPGSAY